MKAIFFILLFPTIIHAQFFAIGKSSTAPPSETCGSTSIRGEFIRDNFTGTSLDSSKYTILNSAAQTISVSGGKIHFVGTAGTTKNVTQMLKYSNYGYSMIRNYTVMLDSIQFNSLSSTDKGPFVGVEPRANDANLAASWANVDASNVDSVELLQTNNFQNIGNTQRTSTGLPSINTSDLYRLELIEYEDTITVRFTNITAGTSVSVKYGWNTVSSSPRRPTIFQYSFGGCGSADFTAESFSVSTTEKIGANEWVGNSIETGFSSTSFTTGFPYLLRANTACTWQVMAGAGLGSTDGYINRNEIIAMAPPIVISGYGTNDAGGNQTTYRLFVDALEAAGIQVYVLSVVNGGDPFTNGTYNYSLRVTYFPSEFVDIWTTGQNLMTVGNGLMQDALHPNTAGHAFLAGVIKAKLPALFPL